MFSWIEELEQMHKKMQKECNKEVPTHLPIYFLYYHPQTREINKIKRKRVESGGGIATAEEILRAIHHVRRRGGGGGGATIREIFFYNNKTKSIQPIPILENIVLAPDLFIYNDINSVFVLMMCGGAATAGRHIHQYTERHTPRGGGRHTRAARCKIAPDSI
jgi:hypothetical protein